MLNSRDIDRLRPDVAANCKKFIELCKEEGYHVLVTGTVRDNEYQQRCYERGTGGKPPATFHSVKAGLAFDCCKNVKGHEYDDNDFWAGIGAIGQKMGFEWGGSWKSFVDKPHFQWSDHGKYRGSHIRKGRYPPKMPLYQEDKGVSTLTIDKAKEVLKAKAGLSDVTIKFLHNYRYGDALIKKLAGAMK